MQFKQVMRVRGFTQFGVGQEFTESWFFPFVEREIFLFDWSLGGLFYSNVTVFVLSILSLFPPFLYFIHEGKLTFGELEHRSLEILGTSIRKFINLWNWIGYGKSGKLGEDYYEEHLNKGLLSLEHGPFRIALFLVSRSLMRLNSG